MCSAKKLKSTKILVSCIKTKIKQYSNLNIIQKTAALACKQIFRSFIRKYFSITGVSSTFGHSRVWVPYNEFLIKIRLDQMSGDCPFPLGSRSVIKIDLLRVLIT